MSYTDDEIESIISRNSKTVYKLAFAQMKNENDADDVYQNVFYRFLRRKPVFENTEHEKAWFIRVTLNCSKTSLKSFWRTKVCELDDSFEAEPIELDSLSYALGKLPKNYSAVLHLFYYEDMSIKEIAKALDLSEGSIGMLLTRSRRRLKEIIEKENLI